MSPALDEDQKNNLLVVLLQAAVEERRQSKAEADTVNIHMHVLLTGSTTSIVTPLE